MLEVIQIAFPEKVRTKEFRKQLDKMIPFWNRDVREDEEGFKAVQERTSKLLQLDALH